jgi:rhamnosyltransferase
MQAPNKLRFSVLVPTLNAGPRWRPWLDALAEQSRRPCKVLVLDSMSSDHTVADATRAGLDVLPIDRSTFNHGGTRQIGVEKLKSFSDILVCLTQDAVLADREAFARLLSAFSDETVGAAFGRQLPHPDASPIAAHARAFNYPQESRRAGWEDRARLGFKACFISNSFAAYRMQDLCAVGGFPEHVILGEDTTVAGKLLMAGRKIAYQSEACVYHSHNYTPLEEFKRYFDTGVFHAREAWLLRTFGGAGGEGLRFVQSEMRYLWDHAPWLMPGALWRTGLKLAGYRLGRAEAHLPFALKTRISMFRGFWNRAVP